MTPELWAAWISAGAAVVQAIGAILAILYSVRIASAADARAGAAERAAEERATRAEKDARERIEQARTAQDRQIVGTAIALAAEVIRETRDKAAEYSKPDVQNATYMGTFDPPSAPRLRALVPQLQSRATSTGVVLRLEALAALCALETGPSRSRRAHEWAAELQRQIIAIEAACADLLEAAGLG